MPEKPSATVILAKGLIAVLLLALLIGGPYLYLVRGPQSLLDKVMEMGGRGSATVGRGVDKASDKIGQAVDKVTAILQARPLVNVGLRTVYGQTRPTAELATVSRRVEETRQYAASWAHSEKQQTLEGVFVVKAGYDLTQPWSLSFSEDGKAANIALPVPKILSVELAELVKNEETNGWWNKLSPQERQANHNALLRQAREHAEHDATYADEANQSLKTQLGRVLRECGVESVNFIPSIVSLGEGPASPEKPATAAATVTFGSPAPRSPAPRLPAPGAASPVFPSPAPASSTPFPSAHNPLFSTP